MAGKHTPPDAHDIERFDAALPDDPAAQRRKMFGYPACFVNGNYFCGLHNADFVVRLPGGLVDKFPALRDARQFDPMGGRPMKDWWVIPAEISGDDERLADLIADTFAEVIKLPPKEPKPPRERACRSG